MLDIHWREKPNTMRAMCSTLCWCWGHKTGAHPVLWAALPQTDYPLTKGYWLQQDFVTLWQSNTLKRQLHGSERPALSPPMFPGHQMMAMWNGGGGDRASPSTTSFHEWAPGPYTLCLELPEESCVFLPHFIRNSALPPPNRHTRACYLIIKTYNNSFS